MKSCLKQKNNYVGTSSMKNESCGPWMDNEVCPSKSNVIKNTTRKHRHVRFLQSSLLSGPVAFTDPIDSRCDSSKRNSNSSRSACSSDDESDCDSNDAVCDSDDSSDSTNGNIMTSSSSKVVEYKNNGKHEQKQPRRYRHRQQPRVQSRVFTYCLDLIDEEQITPYD